MHKAFIGLAIAVPFMIFAFLLGVTIGPSPGGSTVLAGSEYAEVIDIPGGGTVRLSCQDHYLVAVSDVFSNEVGMTGGDVAVAKDSGACRDSSKAAYVGNRTDGRGTVTAHLYQKGATLIVISPIRSNQMDVTGADVALGSAR